MPVNSDNKQDRAPLAGRAHRARLNVVGGTPQQRGLSVFNSPDSPQVTLPPAAQLGLGAVKGTVGASMSRIEEQFCGSGSGRLLSGGPLHPALPREAAIAPGVKAGLIAELREISGQVNRMMAQVDRAIHRLGEHAGEPLRR